MIRAHSKLLSAATFLIAAAAIALAMPAHADHNTPVEGHQYYTAYNFKVENDRYRTTNYWRGEMIPINTSVRLVKLQRDKMILEIDGHDITVENVEKYSRRSMDEIAYGMLSRHKVRTRGKFKREINSGIWRRGMSKADVIKTRGYPPGHQTSSTESNYWKYWDSRFSHDTFVFRNGKLIDGPDIY